MSLANRGVVRFDEYELDRAQWQLSWRQEPVPLNRKTFDLLCYLVDHRERVVAKDELMQALWRDQFIEDSNLTQHIFLLRKGLSRHASNVKMIETVPGRGYRFAGPVVEPEPVTTQLILGATESITRITIEQEEDRTGDLVVDEEAAGWGSRRAGWNSRRVGLVGVLAAVLLVLAVVGWKLRQHWLDDTTGPPVAVVLTPFEGSTGDTILDNALVDGLRIDLSQSPFVSLVSPAKIRATLTEMRQPETAPLTPSVAAEVCERTNSQVVLHGMIARAGQHFLLTEQATSCVDGTVLAQAKQEADSAQTLPRGIDELATSVRRTLGESRRTITRFDTPLFAANTSSLEALKEYSQGLAMNSQGRYPDAISLLKKAIAADPSFAAAYYQLSVADWNNEDFAAEHEVISTAYTLRDGATEPFRLAITALYHLSVTQDLYESERNYRRWTELYPRAGQAWNGLSTVQRELGHYPDALAAAQRALALLPEQQGNYTNVAYAQMQTGDLQGAKAACEAAIAKGMDGDHVRWHLLLTAYALNDAPLITQQLDWAAAHPDAPFIREQQAEIALTAGRFNEAHRLLAQVDAILRRQGESPTADYDRIAEGGNLMEMGDYEEGKRMFRSAPFDTQEKSGLKGEAGVVGMVQAGDIAVAENKVHAMQAEFPQGTLWNDYVGPEVEARADLALKRPNDAVAVLERARPLEGRGNAVPILRAEAYLAAGKLALAETAYRGILASAWQGPDALEIPLAWLGLGRALAGQGKRADAVEAYRHFLALWAHADPDATLLKQARQELAGLQAGPA